MAAVSHAPHRFTVEEYQRMGETGVLSPDARVELVEGEIIDMSPIGPPHASIVNRITRLLVNQLGDSAIVQIQGPVRLSGLSELQPDATVLRPRDDFYAAANPVPADVVLVVEVSHSSLRFDLEKKVPLYARSGIPEVWVIDVAARHVLVHTDPDPTDGVYAARRTVGPGDTLTVLGVAIEVAGIL